MISRPSPRTQRVYGVSFSVANFFANSSETIAFLAMSGGLPDLSLEVFLDELGREHDLGVVLGSVLELLQIVQPAVLVDPVDRRDQAHRLVRCRVEMLMDGVWRDVGSVPRLPLPALPLVPRFPVGGVGG